MKDRRPKASAREVMVAIFDHLAQAFGFSRYNVLITAVSVTALLACLCGGIAGRVLQAHGGAIRPRSMLGKTSFRLIVVLEVLLMGFAAYYHGLMIGRLDPGHIVFWVFTLTAMPVLGVIGAQLGYLMFRRKIDIKRQAGRAKHEAAKRGT